MAMFLSFQHSPDTNMIVNAVHATDVSFKYNKTSVLHNISMQVPKGTIYALLGPSGSGKTTMLRIILGRIKQNSGMINVFGSNKPGYFNRIIGYMPQNQGLSPEMSVGETLNYFASIYQLNNKKFLKTKTKLRQILCLESDEKLVSNLSGGQQKALSLALVFLHSPKLVILDEPTVGTDPILGDQIWSYLRSNCCEGVTVIIVTHYIQEATLADHVGMMRNGRMIEEGSPSVLYNKYGETNLETIFIKICTEKKSSTNELRDKMQSYQKNIANFLSYKTNTDLVYRKKNSAQIQLDQNQIDIEPIPFFWLLFILIRRNIQKFLISKLTTMMMFSPVFCTLLMCIIFHVDKVTIPIAVFNEDTNPIYSNQLQLLTKNYTIYSMQYQQYNTLEDAIHSVEMGQTKAALWFNRNFSREITRRTLSSINKNWNLENWPSSDKKEITRNKTIANFSISSPTETANENTENSKLVEEEEDYEVDEYYDNNFEGNYAKLSNETLNSSKVKIYLDNSNIFLIQPVLDLLNYNSWELVRLVAHDHNETMFASPVQIQEIVYAKDTTLPDFLLSGYMIAFLYLSQVTMSSQLLILEKNDGFFDRTIVAGAKHSLMFFSHFITNLLYSIIQIILMFFIGFVWYQIPNFGSYWLAFVLIMFQSASSIMTGLLISSVCKENFSAFFVALSITISQLFTSGAIFSIISLDPVIKFLMNITPISMPVESLRNLMLRGWNLQHYYVIHGLLVNITTTILFGTLALFFFNRRS